MSDLIQRLERATSGEFHEDYSAQDYLTLCHEALAALKIAAASETAALLTLSGEGEQIGDLAAHEAEKLAGQSSFTVRLDDGRRVLLVGLTHEECRGCVPAFMAPARLTVSAG